MVEIRRNRHPQSCYVCHHTITVGQHYVRAIKNKWWRSFHQRCYVQQARTDVKERFTIHIRRKQRVRGKLGDDSTMSRATLESFDSGTEERWD